MITVAACNLIFIVNTIWKSAQDNVRAGTLKQKRTRKRSGANYLACIVNIVRTTSVVTKVRGWSIGVFPQSRIDGTAPICHISNNLSRIIDRISRACIILIGADLKGSTVEEVPSQSTARSPMTPTACPLLFTS